MPFPLMKSGSGKVLGVYSFGTYTCMLVWAPESPGPIKYLFHLIVTELDSSSPVLVVTCEQNEMQDQLIGAIYDQLDEEARREFDNEPKPFFLCYFDRVGDHHLVEKLPQPPDQDTFATKAFALVATLLSVTGTPQLKNVTSTGKISNAPIRATGWLLFFVAWLRVLVPLGLIMAFFRLYMDASRQTVLLLGLLVFFLIALAFSLGSKILALKPGFRDAATAFLVFQIIGGIPGLSILIFLLWISDFPQLQHAAARSMGAFVGAAIPSPGGHPNSSTRGHPKLLHPEHT